MIYSDVIIIGAGPAGSTCAWKLKQNKVDCIILDSEKFPRTKLCAGWITPKVFKLLELDKYSKPIIPLKHVYLNIGKIKIKLRTKQLSIRRYELDNWLLKRSKAKVYKHLVKKIKKQNNHYIIDNKYKCKYLIGAGGTFCPVYRTFFSDSNPRDKKSLIVCMEQEFKYNYKEKNCQIWLCDNKLAGYSWYVPKGNKYLNIGVGALADKETDIQEQWKYLVKKLKKLDLVKNYKFKPKGYAYYIRQNVNKCRIGNAFIVGDAAGLATKDLAEGIQPAIESGILAAESIINKTKYSLKSVKKSSYPISSSIFFIIKKIINLFSFHRNL